VLVRAWVADGQRKRLHGIVRTLDMQNWVQEHFNVVPSTIGVGRKRAGSPQGIIVLMTISVPGRIQRPIELTIGMGGCTEVHQDGLWVYVYTTC
jgi:hypothetical protein